MRRILIDVEYDGRYFFGWQKQTGKPTIQGELEKALFVITGKETEVFGSGRTDKGVHAICQKAHFDLDINIPVKNIPVALNNILPEGICVNNAVCKPSIFHARYDVVKKTYLYQVYNSKKKSALLANRYAFVDFDLDMQKMNLAAKMIEGKHNFKAFCCSDTNVSDFNREVFEVKITSKKSFVSFEITGSGFLYNMVRIIVGTLIDVGRGIKTIEDIENAFKTGERCFAGVTMPPQGLFLKNVFYK